MLAKKKTSGEIHLSHLQVLFLEEIFLHFFPCSFFPSFYFFFLIFFPCLQANMVPGSSALQRCGCAHFLFISPSTPLPLLPLSPREGK